MYLRWNVFLALLGMVCFPAFAFGQNATASHSPSEVTQPRLFDLAALDRSADPCEDFYQFACGTWRKNNPVPPDQTFWARYNQLAEYNRQVLRHILEQAAAVPHGKSTAGKTAGDFYASCMNEAAVNKLGPGPLRPELARIAAISSREQLIDVVARLQSLGVPVLFEFGAQPDLHDATREVATVFQGGLGLPDRDYYVNQDENAKRTRSKYLEHIAAMLALAGDDTASAEKEASAVLAVETKLAEASFERVKLRDPRNRDHKMPVADLVALAPNLLFIRFFQSIGAPAFTEVNVVPPDFMQRLNETIASEPLDAWKIYLKWHVIQANAPFLSAAFVREDFEFEQRFLRGQRELADRWKRCVTAADRFVGQALGRLYVEQTFAPATKQRTQEMVRLEEAAMAEDFEELDWMTPETRQQALQKLKAITNKIGYPEKWLDYSPLNLNRDDLIASLNNARAFQLRHNLEKIGRPLDKSEWTITTPTVNAYYYPPENSINFPAGVFQPPLFDPTMDNAVNFGAIGWLIGHELTHGFDDQGSKFNGQGNLANWWTESDRKEFDKRTGCLADQYQEFLVIDDVHLNGRLSLGENTADNGGIRIALAALHKAAANKGSTPDKIDGFTADQRFFIAFAQAWCANVTPERLRVEAKVDNHAPVWLRTLGTLQNDADFAKAFGCKAGQKMVRENACRVW